MNTPINSDYATVLKTKKFLFMPTCIIVEMLNNLYKRVATINLSGSQHAVVPDLLVIMRRLNGNLQCTVDAYRNSRIGLFIGDWEEDKLRARKLFFNLMTRLGYLNDLISGFEKRLIYSSIEAMGRNWFALDKLLLRKTTDKQASINNAITRHFRNADFENWRALMANMILYLHSISDYPDKDTYLILVCYEELRNQLLNEIGRIEIKNRIGCNFPRERVVSASPEETALNCGACSLACCRRDAERRGQTMVAPKPAGAVVSLKRVKERQLNSLRRGLITNRYSSLNSCPIR